MALWLVRAGRLGKYENKFLEENRIYLTWGGLSEDLGKFKEKKDLYDFLVEKYSDDKMATIRNWTGQIWPIAKEMKKGDWIVLPSKKKPAIHFAEITGDYVNTPKNENPFYHYRDVKWFATDIPRSNFDQDLLYSFGAFMTICRITRNDAEKRIKAMAKSNWKATLSVSLPPLKEDASKEEEPTGFDDFERIAKDQIVKFIIRKFKGQGMAELVEAILNAQGYCTYHSPEGPDKGIDTPNDPRTTYPQTQENFLP